MQTKKIEFRYGFGIFPEKSEQNDNVGIELTKCDFLACIAISNFRLIESMGYYE